MDKIIIAYWKGSEIDTSSDFSDFYKHKEEYEYSKYLRSLIVEDILDKGYNVMTQKTETSLIIWISEGKFTVS